MGIVPTQLLSHPEDASFRSTSGVGIAERNVIDDVGTVAPVTDATGTVGCTPVRPEMCGFLAEGETETKVNHEQWLWKDTGAFAVTLTAQRQQSDGSFLDLCTLTRNFVVERNTDDPDRQAVDYYASGPFDDPDPPSLHAQWHEERDAAKFFLGDDWLLFHRLLVKSFDDWRAFFGYPPITPWDGSTPVPITDGGYTMAEETRPATLSGQFTPDCYGNGTGCAPEPWFTAAGNGTPRGDDLKGSPCYYAATRPNQAPPLVPVGQRKLADFKDARGLGCVLNKTHHAFVHQSVGGAFRAIATTPRDPLFYAYHKWISGFGNAAPSTATPAAAAASPSVLASWEAAMAAGGPGISAVIPSPDVSVSQLPGIAVLFWEPVTGVTAAELTVGRSHATKVVGSGAGLYVFSGFPAPSGVHKPVHVHVKLAGKKIHDANGHAFRGAEWDFTVSPDRDGDGIPDDRDNCPTVANPDQRNTDAIQRAVFGYEHVVDGLADDLGDACDDDADGDGIPNAVEIANGSDPLDWRDPDMCPFDPMKTAPGTCGCNAIEVPQAGGGVTCAIACPPASAPTGPAHELHGCGDDDPCTTDGCTQGPGCTHTPLTGLAGARCVCDRPLPIECHGQRLPAALTKAPRKACALLAKAGAGDPKSRKVRGLVEKSAASWKSALRASEKKKLATRLGGDCVHALATGYADAKARATSALSAQ